MARPSVKTASVLIIIILLLSLFIAIALPRLLFPPQPELTEQAYRKQSRWFW